ncbi:MAG: substrate-binding domain-containing protein [Candidatus Limiplasma sp.]|nr:substrate-binding domain-containing protein [Candidatus Limiplasma sp.]
MKRFLWKMLVWTLTLALLGVCAASAVAEVDTANLKIGLSMQTLGAPYFVVQNDSFIAYCQEKGITVYASDAQGDMTKQQADCEDLVARGVDVLVINPCDAQGVVAVTKAATEAGVAVFIMDNSASPDASYISMIQSNNLANGELVGNWLAEHFGEQEIRLGVLSGNQGNLLGVDRRIGVVKGVVETQLRLFNATNFKIVTQGWGGWAEEGGLNAAEDMIQAAPDMNCIVAENDSMALGAYTAVKNAGKEDSILVLAAADGQKEALALIKEGKYGATGLNIPSFVAEKTLDTILMHLSGEKVPALVNTEPACINASNVDQYYDPDSAF